jgi:hypothetical protein
VLPFGQPDELLASSGETDAERQILPPCGAAWMSFMGRNSTVNLSQPGLEKT